MGGIITALNRLVEAIKAMSLNVIPVLIWNLSAGLASTVTDGQTVYFGCHAGNAPQTTADISKVYIPKTCNIKQVKILWRAGTAGTNENISAYIRINNTTDYLIQTIGSTAQTKEFSNILLNIAVNKGDYFEIKLVYPTWATNPANVLFGGMVYAEN